MAYRYKRPEGDLHKVSMVKWNKTFAKRGRWPFVVAEVYLQEDKAIIQYVTSTIGKIYFTLALPVMYWLGVYAQGVKDTNRDILDILFQKSRGSFPSDVVYRDKGKQWDKLMDLLH